MRLFKLTISYKGKQYLKVYPFPQDIVIKIAERYSAQSFDIHIVEVVK